MLAAIRGGEPFCWCPNDAEDRLVIFTERIETLNWLAKRLAEDLKLRENQIETLHGGMTDLEQQRVVEDFGNAAKPVRLAICSDVAAEGINLHYHCHRLIHFDMPWSLMVFAQRNGRVDRYGQTRTPQIVYLTTASGNDVIRGDGRVLEVLKAKDEQAYRNIGDPSAFMNVHDIVEEEAITAQTIANGAAAESFDATLTPAENNGESLLKLFTSAPQANGASANAEPQPPPSLYGSDLAYCEAALHRLREKDRALHFEVGEDVEALTLDAPEDLRDHFTHLPPEKSSRQLALRAHHRASPHGRSRRRQPPRRTHVAPRTLPVAPASGGIGSTTAWPPPSAATKRRYSRASPPSPPARPPSYSPAWCQTAAATR